MRIQNKKKLPETALNYSLDIDFQDFMNLYKKLTAEKYSFSVSDTTLSSDNPLCFLLEQSFRINI